MDVSVIIVNYNTCDMTRECIESILRYTSGINYEIILVDNGSIDGSKEYFESHEQIKYVYSKENLGFGRANNLGASLAKGNFFFFLNSDTLLMSNAIKIFYDTLIAHEDIAVLGGQLLWPNLQWQQSYFKFPTLKSIMMECIGIESRYKTVLPTNKEDIIILSKGFVSGADLFISREVFYQFKGFYPGFFMYYEETDLQYKVSVNGGYKIGFHPKVEIIHYNGGSQKKSVSDEDVRRNKFVKLSILNKSRIVYFKRNSPSQVFALKIIVSIGILLRYILLKGDIFKLLKEVWAE